MIISIRLSAALAVVIGTLSPASASFCIQPRTPQDAIDYLICLHNEQADILNEHARIVNGHAANIDQLGAEVDDVRETFQNHRTAFDTYARKVVGNEIKADQAAREIESLKQRIEQLESILRQHMPPKEEFFWRNAR